jgi:site-specific DNA recombinase
MSVRAAIYARYSTDNQNESSIVDQLRRARAHAAHNGLTIIAELADPGLSGTLRHRPGVDALIAMIERHQIDIVLTEDVERVYRDSEHLAYFRKLTAFHRVRIVQLSGGDDSPISVGLKGILSEALLERLAAMTHRGLEGVILGGRLIAAPYGYRKVQRLGPDGEPVRGLREVDEAEAAVIRRIFRDYAAGASPRAIAQALNRENIPGPGGRIWNDDTIRGRGRRVEGILRNPIYDGRILWNRRRNKRRPDTGARAREERDPDQYVWVDAETLHIVPRELWQAVQERLAGNAATRRPAPGPGLPGYWDRRRPRYLLTNKTFCGLCGATLYLFGKDYLTCSAGRNGACRSRVSIRRPALTALAVDALRRHLMPPKLLAAFVEAYRETWREQAREATAAARQAPAALAELERKIRNLVKALAEGAPLGPIRGELDALEREQDALRRTADTAPAEVPDLPDDLAGLYRQEVNALIQALEDDTSPDVLDAARRLIEKVLVTPPETDGDPPIVELVGDLQALLHLALATHADRETAAIATPLITSLASSAKREPRAAPLAFRRRRIRHVGGARWSG